MTGRAVTRSPLSDGRWHRPHPLTPLLRGGFVLIAVSGVIVANLRERIIGFFLPRVDPALGDDYERWNAPGDPVDWVLANDLVLVAALAVLGVLVLLIVAFTLAWRFHTFRITEDDVEVRRGVLFRSHRRAPLDRVQAVNLTRPFVARLLGLAKLEVVGAGLDANVRLEYLRRSDAETVRADILRLASGIRSIEGVDAAARPALLAEVAQGIRGLADGDEAAAEPDSVVRLPPARIVLSHLLDTTTVLMVLIAVAAVVVAAIGPPWILFVAAPIVFGMGAYQVRQIVRSLRYAIVSTPDGVRITFGLLTTVTETIPPGRIHAVELSQPLLWRPAGWWAVRINRVSGKSASDTTSDQFTTVMPVGTAADAARVLGLVLPGVDVVAIAMGAGTAARPVPDPFTTMPRRAWFLRPLSWRRTGVLRTAETLLLRRGAIWRTLAIVPFARMQSVAVQQGPLARAARVARLQVHTVAGPVRTAVVGLDRDAVVEVWEDAARTAVAAASVDRSHRWAVDRSHRWALDRDGGEPASVVGPVPVPVVGPVPAPGSAPAGIVADTPVGDAVARRVGEDPRSSVAPTSGPDGEEPGAAAAGAPAGDTGSVAPEGAPRGATPEEGT